jgi:hypothetical protein
MKKITSLIILFVLFININGCSGYKPIYVSSNFEFEIADYLIEGDKKLGNEIYSKLYNLTRSNKNQGERKSIYIAIKTLKEKNATAKDGAGKILEYKINLNTQVIIRNYLTDENILDHNFILSTSYKAQEQYSETKNLEARSIENLLNRTYQEILTTLAERISTK